MIFLNSIKYKHIVSQTKVWNLKILIKLMNKLLKIGHRGAKGHLPENTLVSIQKALDLGVDGIEIDVHVCKSGELVVFHDFTLDRMTNGKGEIKDFTLIELKRLKVVKDFQIPTLEEVLDMIDKKCFINIELKGLVTVVATISIIENYINNKHWKYSDFIVSSFQHQLLESLYKLNKQIPIGVLTDTNVGEAIQIAKHIKAVSIHPDYTMLTQSNVKQLKGEGFKVLTWTVNKKEAIDRVIRYKVDGIISDFPDRL